MDFVPSTAVIQIDLNVTRYRIYQEDGVVEIWGHVGDYEVCVHLPVEHAEAKRLMQERTDTPPRKSRRRVG